MLLMASVNACLAKRVNSENERKEEAVEESRDEEEELENQRLKEIKEELYQSIMPLQLQWQGFIFIIYLYT